MFAWLRRRGSIAGRVTDARGRAIGGARIWVRDFDINIGKHRARDSRGTARTRRNGTYRVRWLAEGEPHSVVVWADGYVSPPEQVVEAGQSSADFSLERACRISGRVVDAGTGAPVEGAVVQHAAPTHDRRISMPMGVLGKVATREDGGFDFFCPTEGRVELNVLKAGYAEHTTALDGVQSGEVIGPIAIRLEPEARLVVCVLGPKGEVLREGLYARRERTCVADWRDVVEAGKDGTVEFSGLRPGPFAFWVYGDPYPPRRVEVTVAATPGQSITVRMGEGGETIAGVVRLDARGVPDAEVRLSYAGLYDDAYDWGARTDALGRFRLEHLPAGEGSLTFTYPHDSVEFTCQQEVEIGAGQPGPLEVDFSSGDAVVEGTVQDPGGKPLPGIAVSSFAPGVSLSGSCITTNTDADGQYCIRCAPPGQGLLRISMLWARHGRCYPETWRLPHYDIRTLRVDLLGNAGVTVNQNLGEGRRLILRFKGARLQEVCRCCLFDTRDSAGDPQPTERADWDTAVKRMHSCMREFPVARNQTVCLHGLAVGHYVLLTQPLGRDGEEAPFLRSSVAIPHDREEIAIDIGQTKHMTLDI